MADSPSWWRNPLRPHAAAGLMYFGKWTGKQMETNQKGKMNTKLTSSRYFVVLWAGIAGMLANAAFGQAPAIVSPPQSQAVPEGGTAHLSIAVTGAVPITYTWHRNFDFSKPYYEATLDTTNCTLTITNVTMENAGVFTVDLQNNDGSGPGAEAVVAVISAGMETNGFVLTIQGVTNSVWTVNCTTNIPPQWFTLTNFSIPADPPVFKFVDLEATNLNRFYEVIPKVY
jgi:hypothetical protein